MSPLVVGLVLACGSSPRADGQANSSSFGTGAAETDSQGSADDGGPSGDGTADAGVDGDSSGGGALFDVGGAATGGDGPPSLCKVPEGEHDADGPCVDVAPPDSFDPVVEWSWDGVGEHRWAFVTPLVGNLTDDNGDGAVDLCDTPDVVVVLGTEGVGPHAVGGGAVFALDGATGAVHWKGEFPVQATWTPALGDIDGDGVAEVVTVTHADEGARVVAFESDGSLMWLSDPMPRFGGHFSAISLADLDEDGDVEILAQHRVFDHEGKTVWEVPVASVTGYADTVIPVAVDLDGEPGLELIHNGTAYHHDGSVYFDNPGIGYNPYVPDIVDDLGVPAQVANLDDDPEPEIVFAGNQRLMIVEHDGTVKLDDIKPSEDSHRAACIHDFDGDGHADIGAADTEGFHVLQADGSLLWLYPAADASGQAGGTAFDFLGSGTAEAIYGDETSVFVFSGEDQTLMDVPRSSITQVEFPVVADVDNDGSAEFVVGANYTLPSHEPSAPAVQVVGDADGRWIPARRIWNQHAYHVTNVREDGTIPTVQPKSWQQLNTFRTQAQIQPSGGTCNPEPAG